MMSGMIGVGGHLLDALLNPLAQSIGDLAYYALIYDFIRNEIQDFGFGMMQTASEIVGASALILMTIWIFFQGLRIVTGTSRDSMMALVINSLKATLIIAAATTVGVAGSDMHDFLTDDLQTTITQLVTGEDDTTAEDEIDKNLAYMQLAMSSIDALQVINDPNLYSEKNRALWMVGIGTAGPAMVGGALLLMYQVAMALVVGLAPLFILCLLFDATKSLFVRWVNLAFSTMFSMAVLAAMVAIATKVVLAVAGAFWATALVGSLLPGNFSTGMTSMAMQQGGIGLLLTVLLISTPPMAGSFFQGTVGNFISTSQVGTMGAQNRQGGYVGNSYIPPQPGGGGGRPHQQPHGGSYGGGGGGSGGSGGGGSYGEAPRGYANRATTQFGGSGPVQADAVRKQPNSPKTEG